MRMGGPRMVLAVLGLLAGAPALAQTQPGPAGGQGGGQPGATAQALQNIFGAQSPEQRRALCRRVGEAAARCGLGTDIAALSSCLIRTLPPEDSVRVARIANTARGNAGALLTECGITFGR